MSKRNVAILFVGVVVLALCCGCIDVTVPPAATPAPGTTTHTVKTPATPERFSINYPIAATFFVGSDYFIIVTLGDGGIAFIEDSETGIDEVYWQLERKQGNMRQYRVIDAASDAATLVILLDGTALLAFDDGTRLHGTWN